MYIIEFVNAVRQAQGYESIDHLPREGEPGVSPLERAMGCRLEPGLMRLSSPAAAQDVAVATGQPLGFDGFTVALPGALSGHAGELDRRRARLEPGTYDGHGDATRAAL